MLSADVREIEQPPRYLVGFSIRASLKEIIEKKLGNKLRDDLAARGAEIPASKDAGAYLVQIYEKNPNGWTPDTPFTQIVAKEVSNLGAIPEGMVSHTIPAGKYLRFQHEGPMREIGQSYTAMHRWLATEQRGGPCPFDFEYWEDMSKLEEEDTRIGIHLPLRSNGKVGA